MSRAGQRLDLTWRRPNLLAAVLLVSLLAAGLATKLAASATSLRQDRSPTDASIPVHLDKVRQATVRLDPNTAPPAQLELLPDVGPKLAQQIVATREAASKAGNPRPFQRLADLDAVPGIGPKTIQSFAEHLALPE